jgi:membrane-bound metal-dependent hydrolase YbcI (DUF457 family)
MHVGTHFFAAWMLAAAPGLTRRERALVCFAGVAPDLDGLGIIVEMATANSPRTLAWYSNYHHILGHNLLFALVITALAASLAKRRTFTAVLAFAAFHLHLVGDLAGSRGADGYQWPIPYLWPFSDAWQLVWGGQWMLGAWQNTAITIVLVLAAIHLAWRLGYSPAGLFSEKADRVFVATLRARFPRKVASTV